MTSPSSMIVEVVNTQINGRTPQRIQDHGYATHSEEKIRPYTRRHKRTTTAKRLPHLAGPLNQLSRDGDKGGV